LLEEQLIVGSDERIGLECGAKARLEVSLQGSHHAIYVLRVLGELDLGNYHLLQRPLLALLEDPAQRVVVDLSDCAFIDSTGIQALIRAHQAVAKNGASKAPLVVCAARGQVRRVLQLSGVADAIPLFLTQREALELVEPGVATGAPESSATGLYSDRAGS
jgi:anti-sigma B factor antagonist